LRSANVGPSASHAGRQGHCPGKRKSRERWLCRAFALKHSPDLHGLRSSSGMTTSACLGATLPCQMPRSRLSVFFARREGHAPPFTWKTASKIAVAPLLPAWLFIYYGAYVAWCPAWRNAEPLMTVLSSTGLGLAATRNYPARPTSARGGSLHLATAQRKPRFLLLIC